MNSQASASADSRSFDLLDERIRRWIWREGWTELRDAQERAVPALIYADRDIIIAAQTAAGKTEAAFLPILSNLLRESPCSGSVLYVSPLKALINDQWSRLDSLCEELEISVVGWHGDVSSSRKQRFFKNPTGVLLITPESLEAMFVNRGSSMAATFASLRYIVVDELHAFIGSERGKQLQSLMYRVERACGHTVPRVGLSATLGDMQLAARFLRPGGESAIGIIESKSTTQELKVLIKGFVHRPPRVEREPDLESPNLEDAVPGSTVDVANQLYASLRGSNNLIFPNSRRQVETYADLLRRACERDGYPNEFWPHHGSLSKELREDTERVLKEGARPASAICTTTLELGIDIGSVKSIAQIGAPPSVASLRQRLGRSGRRKGEPSILRGYCIESDLAPQSDFSDRIRESLVQSVAMVHLLMRKWFEPPRIGGLHASSLVQQILSIIAERGGCTAGYLWSSLIASGTFDAIDKSTFTEILLHLGKLDLIVQSSNGLLLHGEAGEKLVNHYEFYSAFATDEEFRLIAKGRQLGSLPVAHPLTIGQGLIFAGRRWRVQEVDEENKTIYVLPDHGGAPPQFDGNGAMVHDEVRREMRRVLASDAAEPTLDARGRELLQEARRFYADASLASAVFVQEGAAVHIATWRGDWINDTLALLLKAHKIDAFNGGVVVSVTNAHVDRLVDVFRGIGEWDATTALDSLGKIENLEQEKWDWALPEKVRRRAFASTHLDIGGALAFARELGSAGSNAE
ncbi:DEAD/DEAH box helicase [Burkholderia anthina]|uniref:DEAD/DEAH box helicase n=1 Tax=Burkholderia anthina TaxID=179879 RepID=UPI0037C05754